MSVLGSLVRAVGARVLPVAVRVSGRRAGLVLVYHALAEHAGDPDRELVPAHATALFEAQIEHVRAHYRLVPADELRAAAARRRRGGRFPVALTFDDDLPSHSDVAAPILARAGVPAIFFLCGASLDRPFSFWWQRLQRAIDLGRSVAVDGDRIHELATRIEGMSAVERAAVTDGLERELGPDPEDAGLRRAQARELVDAGFDVGFHTLRHDRLTDLDDDALAAALTDGRAELESALGRPLAAISYPHGRADRRVAAAAAAAGFRTGFTGRHEPVVATDDPLLLGRLEPTFGSVHRFALQLVRAVLRPTHR